MLKKIIKYLILSPANYIIYQILLVCNNKIYVSLFNFFSLLNRSSNKIYFKDNSFYIADLKWRFSNKNLGILFYIKGFEKRKNYLKKSYLINNLNFFQDDVIIDVGANYGDFYLCFSNKIDYYGIEPSPKIFSDLEYNLKNQNLYNLAISNFDKGNVDFFISDDNGDSSLHEIKNYTKKISIQTTTLDTLISKINKKIKLIKIEGEGHEPEILEGLKKNLHKIEYITIDCGFERGVHQTSTIAQCSNYLINNNFKMINFGYERVTCLYKNNNY